jgi:predicted metal-dependent phosphoesterase TrpH
LSNVRHALLFFVALLSGCAAKETPASVPQKRLVASTPARVEAVPATAPVPTPAKPPSVGFLKGQTHCHSNRSYDAKTPPERVLAFYKQRGYDFVSITDHNRVTVIDAPDGLLAIPGMELSQNSTICDPKPMPGFRCLFHLSGLFLDPARDEKKGERVSLPFQTGRLAAYQEELGIVKKLDGIAVLNHPLFHFAANARMISALAKEGVTLVELINASLDQQHPKNREAAEARAEALWDEVLSAGTLVYAVATDDAHHFDDAADRKRQGKFAYVGDRAWIRVRAEKNPGAIRAALVRGDFYASTGVELSAWEPSKEALALQVAGGGNYSTRFIGKGGRELARVAGAKARYEIKGDEGYVRAVVADDQGRKAWLQPVMLP